MVFRHPSEKYEFVNWDDEKPNRWENRIDGNQTTNQQKIEHKEWEPIRTESVHICSLPSKSYLICSVDNPKRPQDSPSQIQT